VDSPRFRTKQPIAGDGTVTRPSWSHNSRGEYYVVVQALLVLLVLATGRTGTNEWPDPWERVAIVAGSILGAAGLLLATGGTFGLGRENLSPLPHPRDGATLVQRGAYAIVRHPIYGGFSIAAFGWALAWRSPLAVVAAAILLLFLDLKARREERWLERTFPEYASYKRRVRKLVPLLY
jgi:protein-S-isoprenylcysteine O-methyltransferase Ste14